VLCNLAVFFIYRLPLFNLEVNAAYLSLFVSRWRGVVTSAWRVKAKLYSS